MKIDRQDNDRARRLKIIRKTVKYTVCVIIAVFMLFPMYWMITTSFKTTQNVAKFPPQWWPDPWTLDNYREVLLNRPFFKYLRNSLYTSAVTTFGVVALCSLAGYAFAKIRFKGSSVLFMIILCGMMMPIEVTVIPLYSALAKLKLADSHFGLIVCPMFGYCGAFGTFLMRQYFLTVPTELIQAAKLDGASQPHIFGRIMVPMASSTISTLVIFTFLQCWNNFLLPLVLLSSSKLYTLPIAMTLLSSEDGMKWELVMAAAVFASLPILTVFYLCQKKFMASLSMTGMKG